MTVGPCSAPAKFISRHLVLMPVYGLIVDVPPLLYLTADHLWSGPIARADRGVDFSLSTKPTRTDSQIWDQRLNYHMPQVICLRYLSEEGRSAYLKHQVTCSHKQSERNSFFHKFSQKWGDFTGLGLAAAPSRKLCFLHRQRLAVYPDKGLWLHCRHNNSFDMTSPWILSDPFIVSCLCSPL